MRVALAAMTAAAAAISAAPTASATTLIADGQVVSSTPITRTDPSADTLTWDGTDRAFAQAVQNANPALAPTALGAVAGKADIAAQPLCASAGDLSAAQGFCWNAANGDESGSGWIPQGVSTSSGAEADGLVDGRKVVITSWHNGDNSQVRITIADVTDASAVRYLDALLVVPSSDPATGFTAMAGHGDGVVLYGDKLYVGNHVPSVDGVPPASRSGFDVFDLSDFWPTATGTGGTGVGYSTADGKFHADGFPFALPRIGTFTYPAAGCDQDTTTQPCISGASLDTSGATPALVSVAGSTNAPSFGADNGVIVRWPLDSSSGLLATDSSGVVHASTAYLDSVPGVQGVAMRHDQFVLSGPCPEWVPGGSTSPYCLYQAWLGEPVTLTARVATNGENVAYDSQTGQLWYVNEYSKDRIVVHVPWPGFQPPLEDAVAADFTDDGKADLVGVEPTSGALYLYPGSGDGTLGERAQIGSNWGSMTALAAGDFTGDQKPDLIALDGSGALWLYPGAGTLNGMSTLGPRVQIGSGWGGMRQLSVMDVNSDGRSDLLAIDSSGALWAYPGTGSLNGLRTLGSRMQIGSNWGGIRQLAAPGPLVVGGRPYLLAVDSTGALWAYPATGSLDGMSTLGSRVQIGSNWTSMQQLAGADFTGDGVGDLEAIQTSDGGLYLYPGTGAVTGTTTLGSRTAVVTNW